MITSKKIDVYRRRARMILQVAAGPGGWVSAIWSYCPKIGRFELNVSLHSHGLTSLGSTSISVEEVAMEVCGSELKLLVQSPRAMHWHPSGERIVVIEAGKIFIFSVTWVRKVRRNNDEIQVNRISMKRASEITCDHLEEEDAAEREEIGAVAGAEVIGVKISLWQSSINISATAMAVSSSAFLDLGGHHQNATSSLPTSTHATGGSSTNSKGYMGAMHCGRILVGTDSGAVLSLSWGWEDEPSPHTPLYISRDPPQKHNQQQHQHQQQLMDYSEHTTSTLSVSNHDPLRQQAHQHQKQQQQFEGSNDEEEEGLRRAHSVTAASRLLAAVVQPALSSADEHRDILRLWKAGKYALQHQKQPQQQHGGGGGGAPDALPEVIDIGNINEVHYGDSPLPANANNTGSSRLVDVDLTAEAADSAFSANSLSSHQNQYMTSVCAASAVRELHFSDRSRVMVCLYGDGSFTTALLQPCVVTLPASSLSEVPHQVPVKTQPSSTAVVAQQTLAPGQVHTFQVLRSAKVHPVALVAYPLPPSSTATGSGTSSGAPQNRSTGAPQLASAAGAATVAPSPTPQLFEMGSAGVYRSVDYVSSHDIESVLDLTPSLLHKVTRMRKLVTCKAEEEISRVLCMKIVDDGETHTAVLQQGSYGTNTAAVGAAGTPTVSGSFKILAIMQTKHLPTFAPAGGILAGFVGSAGGGGDTPSATDISSVHDSLIGRRLESTSLAVFEVTLLHHHHHSSHHSLSAAGASTAHPHDGASVTGGATVGVTAGMHGYEMHCVCTQAVALTTSRTQLSGSPRPGSSRGGGNSSGWSGSEGAAAAVAQPSMEIIYLSQQAGGAHVLVVEGNGSVVCRPLDNLRAVLFSINTLSASAAAAASAMSPTSLHLSQHLHLVTATAAAGRLILTVWDSQEVSAAAALAPPLTTADAPGVSKSTHDLLKLSLFHPTSDCGGGGNALRNPGSKVVVLPLLIAPAAKALPGQSSGMFVDMNEGMLHYVDAEASQHTSASASLSQSREPPTQSRSVFSVEEGLQEYHTALSAPQLKLPKRLLSDVMHYQLLCAVGNPFQPRRGYRFIQEGMLIASSKQCRVEPFNPAVSVSSKRRTFRHDFGRSSLTAMSEVLNHSSNRLSAGAGASAGPGACDATAAEYLAFVAGGSTVPYKQAQQTSSAASKQAKGASTQAAEPPRRQSPMLWVYNRNTHRWRSTYLIVGNKESRACLLKDIPTAQSVRTAEYAALSVLDARVVVEGLKDHQQKAGGSSSSGRGASSLGTQSLDDRQQGQRSSERSKSDEPVGSPPRSGLLAARVATAAGAAGASVATTAAVKSAAVVKNPTMVNNFSAEYTFAEALAPRRPSSGDSTAKPATVAPAGTDELKGSNSNNSMRRHSANDVMGPSPVSSPGRSTAFKKGVSAGAKTASNAANLDGAAVNSKPAAAGFSMQSLFSGPRWGSMASSGGGSGNPLVGPSADLLSPLPTYHRSTSVLITARSHMSGGTNAVLSVAWYSTHSIVLLTLRRSTYCIELLSREASKMSLNAGKPQPAVHKIIMLPPGYSPSSMEVLVVPCKQPPRGGAGGGAGCPPVRSRSQLFARQTGNGTIAEGDESASDAESALSDSSSDGDEEGEGDDHHHFFGDGTRFGLRRDSNSLNGALDSPSKASHTGLKSGSQDGSTGAGGGGSGGSSSPGLDGCVVVVSDGSTLLSYHVQVEGELKADLRSAIAPVGKASVPASAPPNSANSRCTLAYPPNLVVVDYAVAALWDTTLSALAVKEDFCRTYEQQNPDTPGISFPLKETKVFIQNSPLQEHQLEGFRRIVNQLRGRHHSSSSYKSTPTAATAIALSAAAVKASSSQPAFPVVSLVLLDALGKVWYVDADMKECTLLSAGPVSRLSAVPTQNVFGAIAGAAAIPTAGGTPGGGAGVSGLSSFGFGDSVTTAPNADTPVSLISTRTDSPPSLQHAKPLLGTCFVLHVDEDPAAEAQRKLLQIFQRTSLIQHLRPSGWRMVDRLATPDSMLWVPVAWAMGQKKRRRRGVEYPSPVHAFRDADVLLPCQHRHRLLHSVVTVPLPTLPAHTLHLGITAGGVLVGLSAGCVDVSSGATALCTRTACIPSFTSAEAYTDVAPSLLHIPLLSALFCTCLDSKADYVEVVWEKENSEECSAPVQEHHERVAHLFAQWLLGKIRTSNSSTALLIDHLEQQVKGWAESKGFTHKHDGYNHLTSFLFAHDPPLLCELVSRLGRKLEPSVSRHLFPVLLLTEEVVLLPPSEVPRGLLMPPPEPEEPTRHTASVIRLYESALSVRHLHHAARTLSLACEAVGGSEDHISTAASLVLALELLNLCARTISLRNVMECLEFCLRLEDMLLLHSRGIFGNPEGRTDSRDVRSSSAVERSFALDSSYINTVKNRAMLLISSRRDAGAMVTRRKPDFQNVREGELFTPLTAASPALPYYLGMGVGWIINKAVQNLALPSSTAASPAKGAAKKTTTSTRASAGAAGGAGASGTSSDDSSAHRTRSLPPNRLSLETTRSRCNSGDTFSRGGAVAQGSTPAEHLRQMLLQAAAGHGGDTYAYRVIESIEAQYGSLAVSQMLSRTSNHAFPAAVSVSAISLPDNQEAATITSTLPPSPVPVSENPRAHGRHSGSHGGIAGPGTSGGATAHASASAEPCKHSLTTLLLVQVMRDLFKSSSHYCNVAALMSSLLQSAAATVMIGSHIMSTVSKNLASAEDTVVGAAPQEKVRRILYVFRLNKSLVRGVDADSLLKQRISAQYLRRIIEADVIHGAHGSVYSESPRAPTSPGQSATGSDLHLLSHRSVEYFELAEELLVHPLRTPQHSHCHGHGHSGGHDFQNQGQSPNQGTGQSQDCTTSSYSSAADDSAHNSKAAPTDDHLTKHSLQPHERYLTLLELLKSLAVGMLLVGDVASVGLLLTTLCPHLRRLDPALYDALAGLPSPARAPAPAAPLAAMPASSSASAVWTAPSGGNYSLESTTAGPAAANSDKLVWGINDAQLLVLVRALTSSE